MNTDPNAGADAETEVTPTPYATEATTLRRTPIRTLHVDDDPAFAELTAEFLELTDDRITVETAASADAGLERLRAGGVDCVVSDYDMPGRNGIEFLRAVRESDPRLPFILFTGKGSEEVASDAVSASVTDYLQKEHGPDQYTVLANRIVNVTEKHRTETDLERRTRQHEAVATLGRLALETDDLAALFDEAVDLVSDRLGTEYSKVLELLPDGEELALVAGVGWDDGLGGTATVGTGLDSQAGYTLASTEPVVVTDLATETRFSGPDLLVDHDVVSGVSVVIGSPDDPWGVLGTHTTARRAFTDHDVTFVRNVANVLGAAIDRSRAAEQLRESEARFREIAELSPDGIFRTDTEGVFSYVSPAGEELLGRAATDLVGTRFDRLVADTSQETAAGGIARVVGGETVRDLALTLVDADGAPFEVEVSASPVRRDGEVVLVQGFARDVTERNEREREFQRSGERFRALVDAFPNGGVFLFDDDLRYTMAGGDELADVGLLPEKMVGRTPSQVFPPENAAVLEPNYRAALAGEYRSFEDGWQGRHYHVQTVPLRDPDGAITAGMAVAQNVTERVERERKLDRLRERSRALMHTETADETARVVVDAASEVIGAPLSGFYPLSDDGARLEPGVMTDASDTVFDEPPSYERESDPGSRAALVWDVFDRGEPLRVDDLDVCDPLTEQTPAGSVLIYPVGDHGVFIVSAPEADGYDATDEALTDILVDSLTAALDRVERDERLRGR